MDESIVALAIEALERRKEAIQAEIDALRGAKKAGPNQPTRSAAGRKAQGERMRAYWTKTKAPDEGGQGDQTREVCRAEETGAAVRCFQEGHQRAHEGLLGEAEGIRGEELTVGDGRSAQEKV